MLVQERPQAVRERQMQTVPSLIERLHEVQLTFGYLPDAEIQRLAVETGHTRSQVLGVATFYNYFRLRPPGRHTLRVCDGTACHVKNSQGLLTRLRDELGIDAGETTSDGMFSLETIACLGACGMAPAMMIDDQIYGRLNPRRLRQLLKTYRRRSQ